MKTAVDSSVLLDVLTGDRSFGPASREALRSAYDAGALVACDVVWAEVRASFLEPAAFDEAMDLIGVGFDPLTAEAAAFAGGLWRASRGRRAPANTGRQRVVADFLVGAHALHQADRLLTRDERFYRKAFTRLDVVGPTRRG